MSTLTEEHEKMFWKAVMRCVARLRVVDWTIHKKVESEDQDAPETLAGCMPDDECYEATITLYKNWQAFEPTKQNLKEIAFHEVLHIVLAKLMSLAKGRYVTEEQLEAEEHEVIRRLISYVFRKGTTSE